MFVIYSYIPVLNSGRYSLLQAGPIALLYQVKTRQLNNDEIITLRSGNDWTFTVYGRF